MISKRFISLSASVCSALLFVSCASDVPVPDDAEAKSWTPAIKSSYSGWQPPKEMPAGNADYAAAFEKAPTQQENTLKADEAPAYITLEIVGPAPNSCRLDGQAISDRETDRFLRDFVKANGNPCVTISWTGARFSRKAAAIGDFCKRLGFRTVDLKEIPDAEPQIPAPVSERPANTVSKKFTAKIDRSVPGKEYVVKKGDTLSRIAKSQYHDGNLWYIIYNENKEALKNANRLVPGTKLHLPALQAKPAAK